MRDELDESVNVLGEPLKPCSFDPMTGFFRDGCCNTGPEDRGRHTVCVRVTDEFLAFSRQRGNDLSHPAARVRLPRPPPRRPLVPLRRPLARGLGGRRRAQGGAREHPPLGARRPSRSRCCRRTRCPAAPRSATEPFSRCRARRCRCALRVQVSVRFRKSCSVCPAPAGTARRSPRSPRSGRAGRCGSPSRSSHQAASTQTGPK